MLSKQSIIQAGIHLLAIASGFCLGYVLFEKPSFGLLTAWWLSLYVGFIANIRISAALPIISIYVLVLAADIALDQGWLYPDMPSGNLVAYIAISLARGAILVSPIVVNAIVQRHLPSRQDNKAQQIVPADAPKAARR